jgi:hypothetical protein
MTNKSCPIENKLYGIDYVNAAIESFDIDTADNDYQKGYRDALIAVRDEGFAAPDLVYHKV